MSESQQSRIGSNLNSFLKSILWMSMGGILTLTLLTWIGISRSGGRFLDGLFGVFNPPQPAPQVDVRSIVISQIRSASELTTTIFVMEAVVPTKQDVTVGNIVVGTTKLLYIARGEVRAGVNLGALESQNVAINGQSITLRLPPARILDSKIDVNRSTVYDYNRGFLELGPDSGPVLQTLAQQEALRKIVASACQEGLLEKANGRAQEVVTRLMNLAGYTQVTIETQAPDTSSCQVLPAKT